MSTRTLRSRPAQKRKNEEEPSNEIDNPDNHQPSIKRLRMSGNVSISSAAKTPHSDGAAEDDGSDVKMLKVIEEKGDIFDAPPNSTLIHACNCEGHWGAGIAKAFHDRYPNAYEAYANHCDENHHSLFGKAQLIQPMDDEAKHFVGCLFTSRSMGRKKDSPTRILGATKPAVEDLLGQVNKWNAESKSEDDKVGEVRMCQINSGLFAVPWAKTKALLETINVGEFDVKEIKVVSRD